MSTYIAESINQYQLSRTHKTVLYAVSEDHLPVVHNVAISLYDSIPRLLASIFQALKFYVCSFPMFHIA